MFNPKVKLHYIDAYLRVSQVVISDHESVSSEPESSHGDSDNDQLTDTGACGHNKLIVSTSSSKW